MAESGPGRVVYLVGPSGAGKDTLLTGAQKTLVDHEHLHFIQREVTRPANAGSEAHAAVTMDVFLQLEKNAYYALSWRANGHAYGIPRSSLEKLTSGDVAVISGSRGALHRAREIFPHCLVICVTAPRELLRKRLEARRRETGAEIDARLDRADALSISGEDVIEICNDGEVESGVARLVAVLCSLLAAPSRFPA